MRYAGSKQTQAKHIVRLIPHDVDHYVEPFAGLFSVYRKLLVGRSLKSAIINDVDPDWYAWAMMVRGDNQDHGDFIERLADCRDRFLPELDHEDEIRAEFEACKGRWIFDGDPFAWFFLRVYALGQYVDRNRNDLAFFDPKYFTHGLACWSLERAQQWRAALQAATVSNDDAFGLLRGLGSEHFAYIDPPYYPFCRKYGLYPHELTEDQHYELSGIFRQARFRFLLSMGDNPPARDLYCLPEYTKRLFHYSYCGACRKSHSTKRRVMEWINRNY